MFRCSLFLKEEAVKVSKPAFSKGPLCAMCPDERVQMDIVQLGESWWDARSASSGGSAPLIGFLPESS